METFDFQDNRLKEKPLLSEKEIREELKVLDYKNQFLTDFKSLTKKLQILPPIQETKYSYHQDPEKRLGEFKEYLGHTQYFLNDKLQNWQSNWTSSGSTGVVFGWLVAVGIIDNFPEFSSEPKEDVRDPYITYEDGINYAVFNCSFQTEGHLRGQRSTDTDPIYALPL